MRTLNCLKLTSSVTSSSGLQALHQNPNASVSQRDGLDPITRFVHFFNPAVKFVTTVTDWLTCCGTRSRRIFLLSGEMS